MFHNEGWTLLVTDLLDDMGGKILWILQWRFNLNFRFDLEVTVRWSCLSSYCEVCGIISVPFLKVILIDFDAWSENWWRVRIFINSFWRQALTLPQTYGWYAKWRFLRSLSLLLVKDLPAEVAFSLSERRHIWEASSVSQIWLVILFVNLFHLLSGRWVGYAIVILVCLIERLSHLERVPSVTFEESVHSICAWSWFPKQAY